MTILTYRDRADVGGEVLLQFFFRHVFLYFTDKYFQIYIFFRKFGGHFLLPDQENLVKIVSAQNLYKL